MSKKIIFISLFSLILLSSVLFIRNAQAFIIFGTININNNEEYTNQLDVTLTLYATSDMGPVEEMMIANDSSFYNAVWESYATEKSWELYQGEGEKEVFVKYRNASGESDTYSDTIILDQSAPTGRVIINSEATYTKETSVSLSIEASDNFSLSQMMVSNDSTFPGASWETYATSKAWTVPSSDGVKTVYVKFIDNAQNVSEVFSDSIILDTQKPTGPIIINSGDAYANNPLVNLTLLATDNYYLSEMCISLDSSFTTENWIPYSSITNYTLPSENGEVNVYVKFKDRAENISDAYSDAIILDTERPTGSVFVNNNDVLTNSTTVSLSLFASDNISLSNDMEMMISADSIFEGAVWESFSAAKEWNFPAQTGEVTIYAKFKDRSGNEGPSCSDSIYLDFDKPQATLTINNGEKVTRDQSVNLSFTTSDNYSQKAKVMFSNDPSFPDASWEDINGSSFTKSWKLASRDGEKRVYLKISDEAGNTSQASDDIYLDIIPPQGQIIINEDYIYGAKGSIEVILSATDNFSFSCYIKVMLSERSDFSGANWKYFSSPKNFNISPSQGVKTVYVKFSDEAGNISRIYSDTFELIIQKSIQRLAGADRYQTAVAISQKGWPTSNLVILSRGDDFPDALSASSLAGKYNCPILLTQTDYLNPATSEEIKRLKAEEAIVLGTEDVISERVVDDLTGNCHILPNKITRIGGETRYETSALIAEKLISGGQTTPNFSFISYGENYPDALSASSIAYFNQVPILLVRKDSIPEKIKETLEKLKINSVIITGQDDVVLESVKKWLADNGYKTKRLGGETRYETCAQIAEYGKQNLNLNPAICGICYGENFPDALTLAPFSGKYKAPILLSRNDFLPDKIKDFIDNNKQNIFRVYIAGESDVVSEEVKEEIWNIIK